MLGTLYIGNRLLDNTMKTLQLVMKVLKVS
jgi:hypothetical protein